MIRCISPSPQPFAKHPCGAPKWRGGFNPLESSAMLKRRTSSHRRCSRVILRRGSLMRKKLRERRSKWRGYRFKFESQSYEESKDSFSPALPGTCVQDKCACYASAFPLSSSFAFNSYCLLSLYDTKVLPVCIVREDLAQLGVFESFFNHFAQYITIISGDIEIAGAK